MNIANTKVPIYKHMDDGILPFDDQTPSEVEVEVDWKLRSVERQEYRQIGHKSMTEGPTIMLKVFINLLYIHKMSSQYGMVAPHMLAYHHLMVKRWLRVCRKSRFFHDL